MAPDGRKFFIRLRLRAQKIVKEIREFLFIGGGKWRGPKDAGPELLVSHHNRMPSQDVAKYGCRHALEQEVEITEGFRSKLLIPMRAVGPDPIQHVERSPVDAGQRGSPMREMRVERDRPSKARQPFGLAERELIDCED